MPTYARPEDFLRQYGFVPTTDENGGGDDGSQPGSNEAHGNGVEACTKSGEQERELLVEGATLANRRTDYWRHCVELIWE